MVSPVMIATILFILLMKLNEQEALTLSKCCPKGLQLHPGMKSCVRIAGMNASSPKIETIHAPIDEHAHLWIPPKLRNESLTIIYGVLDEVVLDIFDMQFYEDSNDTISELYSKINPSLIIAQRNCFDTVKGLNTNRVEIKGLLLNPIYKCCFKGGRLNSLANDCEPKPGFSEGGDANEIVDISKERRWLPGNLSHSLFKIIYNTIQHQKFNYVIPEKTLQWEIISTYPEMKTMIRVDGQDNFGRTVQDVTTKFCFDEVTEGPLGSRVLLVYIPKEFHIWKCCANRMYYDLEILACVHDANMNSSLIKNDVYSANYNETYEWIPPWFRPYPFIDHYGMIKNYDIYDVAVFGESLKYKKIRKYEGLEFDSLVLKRNLCYESTLNSKQGVMMVGYLLKSINKCCAKGERLNVDKKSCESISDFRSESTVEEVIRNINYSEIYRWIPTKLSGHPIKVQYNFFKEKYDFNIVASDSYNFTWHIIPSKSPTTDIIYSGHADFAIPISGVTNIFCFDEVLEGPVTATVLLAVQYDTFKCCPKGSQIGNVDFACSPFPGQTVDEVRNGFVDWRENPRDAYWLPTSLRHENVSVLYSEFTNQYTPRGVVSNESIWILQYNRHTAFPKLIINFTDLSGKPFVTSFNRYCFDYLEDSTRVVVFSKQIQYALPKCCYPGQIISPRGICEKYNGEDWSPGLSNFSSMFPQNLTKENSEVQLKYFCPDIALGTQSPLSSRSQRYFEGDNRDATKYSTTYFCNDRQRTADGRIEEVVGSCTFPEYAWTYENVRPVGAALAAALLATAAVVAVARAETRRSAHGRALACHALSLGTVNAIQVAATSTNPRLYRIRAHLCHPYAYSAYFFMMAGNCWLTAITFSMFLNFRKPLGALAPKGGGSGGAKAVWRHFGFMSLAVWGCTGALSTLAIVMHQNWFSILPKGIIVPSFMETRTCFFEAIVTFNNTLYPNPLGSICYYYAPTTILTLSNLVFVVLTSLKIHSLRRGTSILRRDATPEKFGCFPTHQMKKVLFYAKLLLTTGFLELGVEAAFWSSGRKALSTGVTLPNAKKLLFPMIATILDIVRGLLILWLSTGREFKLGLAFKAFRTWLSVAWDWVKGWVSGCIRTATAWVTRWFHRMCRNGHDDEEDKSSRVGGIKMSRVGTKSHCDNMGMGEQVGYDNLGMSAEVGKHVDRTVVDIGNEAGEPEVEDYQSVDEKKKDGNGDDEEINENSKGNIQEVDRVMEKKNMETDKEVTKNNPVTFKKISEQENIKSLDVAERGHQSKLDVNKELDTSSREMNLEAGKMEMEASDELGDETCKNSQQEGYKVDERSETKCFGVDEAVVESVNGKCLTSSKKVDRDVDDNILKVGEEMDENSLKKGKERNENVDRPSTCVVENKDYHLSGNAPNEGEGVGQQTVDSSLKTDEAIS